jgi:hypothetical protein
VRSAVKPVAAVEKRRFSAHRLDVRWAPTLGLGISETVVYGGPSRGFDLGYLIPFFPYYAEQWNASNDDNILWSADASWSPRPGALIEGELLIDDFQYDFETEPHQVGWTVRGEFSPARVARRTLVALEYARIETFVYGHYRPRNRYLHDGVVLGHPMGPDSDRMEAAASWDAAERVTISMALARERRGAQRAETSQATPANPRGVPFPSPPVRETLRSTLAVSWRPRATRRLDAAVGFGEDDAGRAGWSGWVAFTLRVEGRGALP